MALKPDTNFAGKINPATSAYPYGSARNVTTQDDGTGTPFIDLLINDNFGWQQALLDEAGIVPSGSPDSKTTSQYMQAFKKVLAFSGQLVFNSTADFSTGTLANGVVLSDDEVTYLLDNELTVKTNGFYSGSTNGNATYKLLNEADSTAAGYVTGYSRFQIRSLDVYACLEISAIEFHVTMLGVVGDKVSDDTQSLRFAWEYAINNNKVFDTSGGYEYRLSSAPPYTTATGTPCFFSTGEVDNIEIKNGESLFFIDPPNGQGNTTLFESRGTDGFLFDKIKGEVPTAKADIGDTTELLNITWGAKPSSNTKGGSVVGKNTGGVFIRGEAAGYITNGFDSIYRPFNTDIEEIIIDNSEMAFVFGNEYKSYGLICALAGDNTNIGRVVIDNIHRGIFLYGVKGVKVGDGKITQSDACTVNIGSYGSCIDIDIKVSIVQNSNLPDEMTRIKVHEVGTSDGASVDLDNGRIHTISGIDLDLAISGDATANDAGFYMGKTDGDGSDSNIEFRDINISIRNILSGVSRSFILFTEMTTQNCQNVSVSKITLNNCKVVANATIHMPPAIEDNIVVNGLVGSGSLACSYGDLTTTTPPVESQVILNDVQLVGTITPSGLHDCPVTVINSRIANIIDPSNNTPAYNKVFINSWLGKQYIEYKGRYDVYTSVVDSSAMYSPDFPVNKLVAGGNIATINSTPLNLDLTAPSDTKTATSANLYHSSFIGNSTFKASNPYTVKILVQRSGNSGFGVATGTLVAYGVTAGDFTTGTFSLEITSMINTGGQVFQASDFSVSVVDATTLRFSCSREAASMYVIVQRT